MSSRSIGSSSSGGCGRPTYGMLAVLTALLMSSSALSAPAAVAQTTTKALASFEHVGNNLTSVATPGPSDDAGIDASTLQSLTGDDSVDGTYPVMGNSTATSSAPSNATSLSSTTGPTNATAPASTHANLKVDNSDGTDATDDATDSSDAVPADPSTKTATTTTSSTSTTGCMPNFQGQPVAIQNDASGKYLLIPDKDDYLGSPLYGNATAAATWLIQNNGMWPGAYLIRLYGIPDNGVILSVDQHGLVNTAPVEDNTNWGVTCETCRDPGTLPEVGTVVGDNCNLTLEPRQLLITEEGGDYTVAKEGSSAAQTFDIVAAGFS